jgi:hypothetical protein
MDERRTLRPQLQQVTGLPSQAVCENVRETLTSAGFLISTCWQIEPVTTVEVDDSPAVVVTPGFTITPAGR